MPVPSATACLSRGAPAVFAQSHGTKARSKRTVRLHLACSGAQEQGAGSVSDRRSVLLGLAGATVVTPLLVCAPAQAGTQLLPASSLTSFQKRDVIIEFQKRAEEELKKVLEPSDTRLAVRLLLNDAGTYDADTKTGGCNGTVVLPEELNRPENAELKPFVEKLRRAKAAIDARKREGQRDLSWADTIVLAVKVAVESAWREDKIAKAASPEKGAFIADGFGNAITVRLGRVDGTEPAPAGRTLPKDASLEEMQQYFSKLVSRKGKKSLFMEREQFLLWPALQADPAATEAAMAAANPKYAERKRTYDSSRKTVTRTSYEEDFGAAIKLLADLGAKYDNNAYLCPIEVLVPDRY